MKKKVKILGIIVIAMIIGLSMAGCGGTECLDHQVTWTVTKSPQLDAEGEEEGTCPNCDAIETRAIPKYGVFFGVWENVGNSTSPGATSSQKNTRTITIDEDMVTMRQKDDASAQVADDNILDFKINNWTEIAAQTTTTKGYRIDGYIQPGAKGWSMSAGAAPTKGDAPYALSLYLTSTTSGKLVIAWFDETKTPITQQALDSREYTKKN